MLDRHRSNGKHFVLKSVFFCTQSGIQPAWEDERNKKGGRWMINLNKSQRNDELDRFWLEIVCMV